MSLGSSTTASRTDPPKDWARARLRLQELTALIDALTAERQHLQTELDSIVYPVLTLPFEITSHIFLHSIAQNKQPSQYTPPLLLTQICRQWRAIALATPNLWRSIIICRKQGDIHSETLLHMWLQRSASLPISLHFRSLDGAQMQSLIDASLLHCPRWEEIQVSSCANLAGSQKSFPILRKVKFQSHNLEAPPTITILDAPILREAAITLNTSDTPFHGFDVQLPWGQLTSLTLQTFEFVAECLPILSQCSELRTLIHHTIYPADDDTATFRQPHVELSSLQSLHVGRYPIVTHLTLPGLRQLTWLGTLAPAIEPFRALVSRSHCQLQQLTIVLYSFHNKTQTEELQRFYQLFPTITSLKLRGAALHNSVDSLFSSDVLPLMQNLAINAVRVREDYNSLFDVLRTRRSPCSGREILKTFTLTLLPHNDDPDSPSTYSPLPESVLAQFQDLAMEGLVIRIGLQSYFGNKSAKIIFDTFTS